MSAAGQIASIGMKRSNNEFEAKARFAVVLKTVEEFVNDHPEMIMGEGEFSVMFGAREKMLART